MINAKTSPPFITDTQQRPLRDLRISVTDRCNLRCTYCMPREIFGKDFVFLPRDELLDFEEIERVARLFVQLGVHKIRLSGGEPLMRHGMTLQPSASVLRQARSSLATTACWCVSRRPAR